MQCLLGHCKPSVAARQIPMDKDWKLGKRDQYVTAKTSKLNSQPPSPLSLPVTGARPGECCHISRRGGLAPSPISMGGCTAFCYGESSATVQSLMHRHAVTSARLRQAPEDNSMASKAQGCPAALRSTTAAECLNSNSGNLSLPGVSSAGG